MSRPLPRMLDDPDHSADEHREIIIGHCDPGDRSTLASLSRCREVSFPIRWVTECPLGGDPSVMGLALIREVDFVRRMGVAAVRHMNNGHALMWLINFSRGFEIFSCGVKIEHLARIVGSHRFNVYGRVPGH